MKATDTVYSHAAQVAIATDYQANIAAALNILIDKWNEIYTDPAGRSWVNDGSARYVENWYLALWTYNSGFHLSSDAVNNNGHWGVGWLNNPANTRYPYNRQRFLANDNDPSRPWQWSYEEKVMGWIEKPQWKGDEIAYITPLFGHNANGQLSLPDNKRSFCSTDINSCDPNVAQDANPCPANSDACWWHGHSNFADDCGHDNCATELLRHHSSDAEPSVDRIYPRSCDDIDIGRDRYITSGLAPVVYDLNDTSQYNLGCATHPSNGKFTLRVGFPANGPDSPYGQIDLHQLGAGYQGHIWFTHVYPPSQLTEHFNYKHQVIGTWSPDLKGPGGRYDIVAHLPSHGGEYGSAEYIIQPDPNGLGQQDCVINQSTKGAFHPGEDKWVYLGNATLQPGAFVMLSNVGDATADGTIDIAYDAMAFIPIQGAGHQCRDGF
jgi:hypothetical protein